MDPVKLLTVTLRCLDSPRSELHSWKKKTKFKNDVKWTDREWWTILSISEAYQSGLYEKCLLIFWLRYRDEIDFWTQVMKKYMSLSREEAQEADPPFVFIGFPSSKDSTYAKRHPGKDTELM